MIPDGYVLTERNRVRLVWEKCSLAVGQYNIRMTMKNRGGDVLDTIDNVLVSEIGGGDFYGMGRRNQHPERGASIPTESWDLNSQLVSSDRMKNT